MPLISDVEKKSWRARTIYLLLYAILSLGSLTMIYPLMIMLSSSVSSEVDYERFNALPAYLWDTDLLWQKYLGLKYDREFPEFKYRYRLESNPGDFRYYRGEYDPSVLKSGGRRAAADWNEFVDGLPLENVDVFFTDRYRMGPMQLKYQTWLARKYGSIQKYNLAFDPPTNYRYFADVEVFVENTMGHNWPHQDTPQKDVWFKFKETLSPAELRPLSFELLYYEYLVDTFQTVEQLNEAWATDYKSLYEVEFTSDPPASPAERETWTDFVHSRYPMRYARVPGDRTEDFKRFILEQEEFAKSRKVFNQLLAESMGAQTGHDYFSQLRWSETIPENDLLARMWTKYADSLPPGEVEYTSHVEWYRDFLRKKYADVAALNDAHGAQYASFAEARPPYHAGDALDFATRKGHYKREFFFGNYAKVLKYIYSNGYALKNTIILVFLWVFGNLTVQPMAAYALSRFRLSYANTILLILIATMSFPHSVTMIPNFLLLKKLHLLNTYAALILPHLVHGMGIFLLKGYFDSLPRELYEAGMIDGATEFQMFYRITLPLSLPILAVLALQSFAAAYGSFMWAFLICQDETMWTLMVFLYQFQQAAPAYTHMAALVIAGIPTLIVFIFAQRVIMRGIVIPTMK